MSLREWCEGWALAFVITVGFTANLFLLLIIRKRELNLLRDFSRLLQSQAAYDICYLLVNILVFVVPALTKQDVINFILPSIPLALPVIQICLTGKY